MGTILSFKVLPDNQIKFKIALDENEALALKGSVRNIHIFTHELCITESKIIEKGKGGVTKYFLIPPKLRKRSKIKVDKISCNKIETDTKLFFIYTIDKEKTSLF
jgi:hypothetical protein